MLVMRAGLSRGKVEHLAFAPDGRALAGGLHLGGHVLFWPEPADGARAEAIPLPGGGGAVRPAFSADGRTLFAGNEHLYAIDLATRGVTRVLGRLLHTGPFALSPDGAWLVVAEDVGDNESTRLTCRPADRGEPRWEVGVRGHAWRPPLFLPDGRLFVQAEWTRDPATRQWLAYRVTRALDTGAVVEAAPQCLIPDPEQTALSPDGRLFAVRVREDVFVYPAAGPWAGARWVTNSGRKHFTGIAFHPGGRFLAATSNDETVKLYDTETWELAKTFTWKIGKVRSVTFSPDGTVAAAGSDTGKVVVWDVDV